MAQHTHSPWAEVDQDGMYEPSCEGCKVFLEPAIAAMTRRYTTWHDAAAAAASIIDMLPHGSLTKEGEEP